MDFVKKVLAYKFWILFGVVVVLPPVGWWSATGKLSKEIEERRGALDNAFNGIPDAANAPNQSWIDGMKKLNAARERRLRSASEVLWQNQEQLMTWPASIQAQMAKCPFRGTVTDRNESLNIPVFYAQDYPQEIRSLWLIVDPIDEEVDLLRSPDAPRKTVLQIAQIPQVPADQWKNLPPTWLEMWNSQEDIWLLREVFQSIARVNQSASSILDSHVKQIAEVRLFGGWRIGSPGGGSSASASAPGASSYGSSGEHDESAPTEENYDGMNDYGDTGGGYGDTGGGFGLSRGGFFGGGRFPGQKSGAGAEIKIPLSEEFEGTDDENDRYIDEGDSLAYYTRGFTLQVIMDHRRVPDLLVELTSSPLPVEIIRVHQAQLNREDLTKSGMMSPATSPRFPVPPGPTLGQGTSKRMPGLAPKKPGSAPTVASPEAIEALGRLYAIAEAALSGPNLAAVSIVGLFTIYKPMAEPEGEGQTAEGAPTAEGTGASAPTGDMPASPDIPAVSEDDAQPPETPADASDVAPAGSPPAATETPMKDADTSASPNSDAPEATPPAASAVTPEPAPSPETSTTTETSPKPNEPASGADAAPPKN